MMTHRERVILYFTLSIVLILVILSIVFGIKRFVKPLSIKINRRFGNRINLVLHGLDSGPWGFDEPMSSVIGKYNVFGDLDRHWLLRLSYKTLDFFDRGHCDNNIDWMAGYSFSEFYRYLFHGKSN